ARPVDIRICAAFVYLHPPAVEYLKGSGANKRCPRIWPEDIIFAVIVRRDNVRKLEEEAVVLTFLVARLALLSCQTGSRYVVASGKRLQPGMGIGGFFGRGDGTIFGFAR